MSSAQKLAEATDFAAEAHVDQRRKGHRAEPYINHLTDVTVRLARSLHGEDTDLLIAGMLHDTVEDTAITRDDLAARFGATVADLVIEVTDDESIEKAERKKRQIEEAPTLSTGAKMIKLADKTSNVMSLITSPPSEWDLQRLADYVDWAEAVIAGCRGIDGILEQDFDRAAELARKSIAERHPLKEEDVT